MLHNVVVRFSCYHSRGIQYKDLSASFVQSKIFEYNEHYNNIKRYVYFVWKKQYASLSRAQNQMFALIITAD